MDLLTIFLQGLVTAPHPFPLPRSLLYMLTLILLLANRTEKECYCYVQSSQLQCMQSIYQQGMTSVSC